MPGEAGWLLRTERQGATREWGPNLSLGQGPARVLASIPSPAAPKVQPPGASLALIASDPALRLTAGCPRDKKVKVAPQQRRKACAQPTSWRAECGCQSTPHAAGTLHRERRAVTHGRTPPRPPSPRRPHLPRALEMQASELSALKGKPEAVDGQ